MTLHIDQLVECVDASPGYATGQPIELAQNAIYRIRDIGGMTGDLVNVGTIHYYAPTRFRPLTERKTDISELKKLLNPTPEDCVAVLYGSGE